MQSGEKLNTSEEKFKQAKTEVFAKLDELKQVFAKSKESHKSSVSSTKIAEFKQEGMEILKELKQIIKTNSKDK
jgi:hypothetical protein